MTDHARKYEPWADETVRRHMEGLLEAAAQGSVEAYREGMRVIGKDLGLQLREKLPADGDLLFVTTVEDADFLGAGVLEALPKGRTVKVFCYWNERDRDRDTAPIVSRFEEPLDEARTTAVVVIKSIVSGACVVRTNLTEALSRLHHDVPVFVVAPAMHIGAKKKLQKEFAPSVAERFRYVVCAIDPVKEGETIRPGVGGSVYELLGMGDGRSKNRYRPRLVAERSPVEALGRGRRRHEAADVDLAGDGGGDEGGAAFLEEGDGAGGFPDEAVEAGGGGVDMGDDRLLLWRRWRRDDQVGGGSDVKVLLDRAAGPLGKLVKCRSGGKVPAEEELRSRGGFADDD